MCKASQAGCFNQSKSSIARTIHLTRQQITLHQFPSKNPPRNGERDDEKK